VARKSLQVSKSTEDVPIAKLSAFEATVIDTLEIAEIARQSHLRARLIWARVSSSLLAATAIGAAFSGASVISDNHAAAVGLGIATALLAGLSVGLQPSEKAAAHQTAAAGYGVVVAEIEVLLIDRAAQGRTEWRRLRPAFVKVMDRFGRVEGAAPHVRPWKRNRADGQRRVQRILGLEHGSIYGSIRTDVSPDVDEDQPHRHDSTGPERVRAD
jgi:hypothetical protein